MLQHREEIIGALDHLLTRLLGTTISKYDEGPKLPSDSVISAAEEITETATSWLIGLKRSRNRALPINRLPPELLQLVFQWCLPEECDLLDDDNRSMTSYYSALFALIGVSRDWATAIKSSPLFWTYTCSLDPNALTELVIKRSKDSPLRVKFVCDADNKDHPDSLQKATYVKTLLSQSYRWHTLCVRTDDAEAISQLVSGKSPQLNRLVIRAWVDENIVLQDFLGGATPKVVDIDMYQASLVWEQYRLSGLRKLELECVTVAPSISQLLDIIDTSPGLQELYIWGCGVPGSLSTAANASAPQVRVLENLQLGNITPFSAINHILTRVTVHSNSILAMEMSPAMSDETNLSILTCVRKHIASLTGESCPAILQLRSTRDAFQMDYGSGCCDIRVIADDVAIPLPTEELVLLVQDLLRSLSTQRRAMPTALHLFNVPRQDIVSLLPVLDEYLCVTELTMEDMLLGPIVELLSSSRPKSGRWLLPSLASLTLRQADTARPVDPLLVLVEARRVPPSPGMAALKRVSLENRCYLKEDTLARLQELVPCLSIADMVQIGESMGIFGYEDGQVA
ncbi:hypothetical protein FRB99_006873 [Tulasnella sp. 403]|nr:hypothetical protein FRB99_006873 [Tulasnella sp. 403]